MAGNIIQMPRTEAGRQALREALFMLRNCGPAPDGSKVSEVDWDSLVIELDEAFRLSREIDMDFDRAKGECR